MSAKDARGSCEARQFAFIIIRRCAWEQDAPHTPTPRTRRRPIRCSRVMLVTILLLAILAKHPSQPRSGTASPRYTWRDDDDERRRLDADGRAYKTARVKGYCTSRGYSATTICR